MGTIIFSGSWLSFIALSVIWVIGAICIWIGLKESRLNPKQLRHAKFFYTLVYLIILAVLLINNFQYTSRDVSAEVRGFDAAVETQVIECKKVERMTSSDVTEKFYSTLDHEKQENRSNEKN